VKLVAKKNEAELRGINPEKTKMAASENYPVNIDSKIGTKLNSFLKSAKYSACFIICDSNTLKFCLSELILKCPLLKDAEIIELEPGEESKDLNIINDIWQTLTEYGADKKSLAINLGGGVVSDIGGFAASTFKRGVDFINIPTTLLAMADASIGGKTGINFSGIKNHIGTITQPKGVFINTNFLNTLPPDHLRNGFAEIIKIALIKDKSLFKQISGLVIGKSFDHPAIIKRSVRLKNLIVKKDPQEKGLRKILNFGHTVGHALESLFLEKPEPLLHGQAIAIGMAIESYLSLMLKRINAAEFDSVVKCLNLNFQFPVIQKNDLETFYRYFKQDKKHSGNVFHLALLKGIGNCDHDVKITAAQLDKAISYYNLKIANAPAV